MIGWWMVLSTGSPSRSMASSPYPRLWLSCTRSKSPVRPWRCRHARRLNASGSGNWPNENEVTSAKSVQSFSSHRPGMRMGKWSL